MNSQSTHNCSKPTPSQVYRMGVEYMNKDFVVGGKVYNMKKLGWRFSMNNNKSRFGVCRNKFSRTWDGKKEIFAKEIQLSEWLVMNCDKTFDGWVNTMLHEIAHAIDKEIRQTSAHDYVWRRIALSIGCDGKRCGSAKVDATQSKYTLTCPNCNKKQAGHKKRRRKIACGDCCNKYNGGTFTDKFAYIVTQNY